MHAQIGYSGLLNAQITCTVIWISSWKLDFSSAVEVWLRLWVQFLGHPYITQSQIIFLTYPWLCRSGNLIPTYHEISSQICKSRHLIPPGLSQFTKPIPGWDILGYPDLPMVSLFKMRYCDVEGWQYKSSRLKCAVVCWLFCPKFYSSVEALDNTSICAFCNMRSSCIRVQVWDWQIVAIMPSNIYSDSVPISLQNQHRPLAPAAMLLGAESQLSII